MVLYVSIYSRGAYVKVTVTLLLKRSRCKVQN